MANLAWDARDGAELWAGLCCPPLPNHVGTLCFRYEERRLCSPKEIVDGPCSKGMTTQTEFIKQEVGNQEAWVCLCGNTPVDQGFFPSDERGIEGAPVQGWGGLYTCDRCGRVIDSMTLRVVGTRIKAD